MRTLVIASVLTLSLATVDTAEDPPRKGAPPPTPVLVPVPGYTPRPGDQVRLYFRDDRDGQLCTIPCARTLSVYRDLIKYGIAEDDEGLSKHYADKTLVRLESGTWVRVLAVPRGVTPLTPLEYRGTEVRVLDGPEAGQVFHVIYDYVRQCREVYPKAKGKGGARPKRRR